MFNLLLSCLYYSATILSVSYLLYYYCLNYAYYTTVLSELCLFYYRPVCILSILLLSCLYFVYSTTVLSVFCLIYYCPVCIFSILLLSCLYFVYSTTVLSVFCLFYYCPFWIILLLSCLYHIYTRTKTKTWTRTTVCIMPIKQPSCLYFVYSTPVPSALFCCCPVWMLFILLSSL